MKISLTLILNLLIVTSWAQLSMPRLFSDHMILQRELPLRFWGKASPGENVTIRLNDFSTVTKADKDGKWELLFPAQDAGGPYEVKVTADSELTFTDVWIGDVWLASGQSNMEWKLGWNVNNAEEEIANGNYPQIRFFEVPKVIALNPQDDITGGKWVAASPETVANFSAVAWFFARENHVEKNVPVGIISSNWGGTPAEAWTSAERLLEVPGYRDAAAEMLDPNVDWEERKLENEERDALKWRLINNKESFKKLRAHTLTYDDSGWKEIQLPNEQPLHDFVWVRKSFNVESNKSARLYLGEINQICHVFLNGELISAETWQDTTGIVEVSPEVLKKGSNTLAIRVINSWDNNVYIGRKEKMWIKTAKDDVNLEGTWRFSNSLEPKMPDVKRFNWLPATIYNQMIDPIAGYSMQGVIWYQGESNADKPQYYNELFETMIEDWRIKWKQGNFPFLFVQLANFMERKDQPGQSNWAELREAQTQTLELPKTGMATIIDIGEADDIHPRNKKDVGYRLWLAAKKVAFGESLTFSGPVYQSHEVSEKKMIVSFSHVGEGLKSATENIKGFALAGEDGKFYWADAKIVGNKVEVWSNQVDDPKHIRYAWGDNPEVSLYNNENLPAVPFRTDSK